MTLEQIPLVVGGILALLALWLVADGVLPDRAAASVDRRRRARAERSRAGEVVLGLGLGAFAAALVGSDAWRWGTVAVLTGGALVVVGLAMNRRFLYEALAHRGPARRGRDSQRRGPTRPDSAASDRRTEEAPGPVDAPGIFPP